MKLTYRGVDYDYNPPVLDVTESEIECLYRGHKAHYTYVRNVPIPQSAERLTYRGVPYQTTRQGQILQIADAQRTEQGQEPKTGLNFNGLRSKLVGSSPAAEARRQLLQESSKLHRSNIERALQHRMTVAKAQGNTRLVEQLESEMSQSL